MFAVIFEVQPKPERWNDYLETARLLRPELARIIHRAGQKSKQEGRSRSTDRL